jgi:hypothetical protein
VPALPACHTYANFRARARSRARRIRPSMCEARATARAPRYRCIRDLCSPCLLPSLRTSSCGCSLEAGCVAADLWLEQTADCVQTLISGVVLELGGHVAEMWWKRKRRSLARMCPCVAAARALHAGAIARRVVRAVLCPSSHPNRPRGAPVGQRVAHDAWLVSVRACVGVEGERRVATSLVACADCVGSQSTW